MPSNPLDLVALLELPNEQFLPEAFRAITGREPDIIGLMHYAKRLQDKLPRVLVLAELRNSAEGRAHAANAVSAELDKLVARYLAVRNLPLKGGRWKFLPRTKARVPSDAAFHWEHWANDYAGHMHARAAQQTMSAVQAAQAPHSAGSAEVAQLQRKLDVLATALQSAVSALQAKGAPEHAVQTLRDAVHAAGTTQPDPTVVSWEARQALQWFALTLRD